jgi:hypothetical protein
MRIAGFFLSLLLAAPAAAQTPLSAIAPPSGPALGPKTLLPINIACTDVPVAAQPSSPLRVLAPHGDDHHEFSYRNDIVVLNGGTPQGLQPGQRFFTRRAFGTRPHRLRVRRGRHERLSRRVRRAGAAAGCRHRRHD